MTRVAVLLALAAVCASASAHVDVEAIAQKLKGRGDALPVLFRKQWTTLLGKVHADFEALKAKQLKKQPESSREVIGAALNQVTGAIAKQRVGVDTLVGKVLTELAGLVGEYESVIAKRIKSTPAVSAEESTRAVLAVRKKKQALLLSWERQLVAIAAETRSLLLGVFEAAVKAHPKGRKALAVVAEALLQQLVHNQIEAISLLTAKQFSAIQHYAVQAGGFVLHMVATVQTARLQRL